LIGSEQQKVPVTPFRNCRAGASPLNPGLLVAHPNPMRILSVEVRVEEPPMRD